MSDFKLGVVGLGLIGCSFAAALRQRRLVSEVVGVGRPSTVDQALALGWIDRGGADYQILQDVDLVMIAVPVQSTLQVLMRCLPWIRGDCIVTDAGSTKQKVAVQIRDLLGVAQAQADDASSKAGTAADAASLWRFVPGHPIAGSHLSGPSAADAQLFVGRNVMLCPYPSECFTPPLRQQHEKAVEVVRGLWCSIGASVHQMSALDHDELFARLSHLPHLLAFAAIGMFESRADREKMLRFSGSGFSDFTRIGAGHPEMWADIMLDNHEALLESLDAYERQPKQVRSMVQNEDREALLVYLKRSQALRMALGSQAMESTIHE